MSADGNTEFVVYGKILPQGTEARAANAKPTRKAEK